MADYGVLVCYTTSLHKCLFSQLHKPRCHNKNWYHPKLRCSQLVGGAWTTSNDWQQQSLRLVLSNNMKETLLNQSLQCFAMFWEWERARGGLNLRRQRLASPTAQMLVAQTTRPVQKNRLRDELYGYVRTDTIDWGSGRGRKRARSKRKRQPGRTGAGQRREWQLNEQRDKISKDVREREGIFLFTFWEWERARAGIEPTAAAAVPSQPDCLARCCCRRWSLLSLFLILKKWTKNYVSFSNVLQEESHSYIN